MVKKYGKDLSIIKELGLSSKAEVVGVEGRYHIMISMVDLYHGPVLNEIAINGIKMY